MDAFKEQQSRTVEVLKQLLAFLREGEQYGVEIDPKFKLKLETGIKATADEKLKVALIGGFSEGKTSIAAAWAEKYDRSSMKIRQEESSDEVAVYSLGDFELIDTPGLFGFKETASKERYKDITKKYVSEAHLVLYVMNPNNPIKESHKEDLVWLFRDLNLFPRTVFVLGRFDDEVDIEDDEDYNRGLEIKRQNIRGRLKDFGLLEDDDVSIVAVSANPFDKGIDYWLARLENFKKLSHIESLQKATTEKIKEAGSVSALAEASKKSIAADILMRELPEAIKRDEKTNEECERLSQTCAEVEGELGKTKSNLIETRIALREFITDLFSGLIMQAKGLDMDTITGFFERNIGSEGIVLSARIQNEFERQLGGAYREINRMRISLESGIEQYNTVIGQMAFEGLKAGGQFLKTGVHITADGIKAARNFIMPALKFKPWGAVKLAGNLNKAIPIVGSILGIVVDVGESIAQKVQEEKFIQEFFPDYVSLKKQIDELNTELREKQARHEQFRQWRMRGEAIEAEFKIIS
jgi:GTPase SAR1 family protein